MVMTSLYARQQKPHRCKEQNRLLDFLGEGEGGMIRENSIETCILSYVRQTTNANLMHEAGHPKLVLWDNPEGGVGREVRGGFRMVGHMYTRG